MSQWTPETMMLAKLPGWLAPIVVYPLAALAFVVSFVIEVKSAAKFAWLDSFASAAHHLHCAKIARREGF